jgi:hypothetical protein
MNQDFVKDGGLRAIAEFVLGIDTFLMTWTETDTQTVVVMTPNPTHYTVGGKPPYLFMLGYFAKVFPLASTACNLDIHGISISVRKNELGLTDEVKLFISKDFEIDNRTLLTLGELMKILKQSALIYQQNYADYASNFQARESVLSRQVKVF